MSLYKIKLSEETDEDLKRLKKSEPFAYKKAMSLIKVLETSPYTGIGKPERLKGNLSSFYSRRITDKHRLVYTVYEEEVLVWVISAYGHYDDK